jgi:glyoxylase-like metal-dependent hydrolase (beta-lactamase superfamily II)
MKIEKVVVGKLKCNCYILSINDKVLVIDPGDNFKKIDEVINGRNIVGIIVTHHHFDHDGAVNDITSKYNTKVYDINNLSEGDNKIDCFKFEVIYTPGHKDDLITIYFKNNRAMFCGDFIFKDGVGRCDLDGGNISLMIDSIDRIKLYDKDIVIYPGHGEATTLGYEINNNVFFNGTLT